MLGAFRRSAVSHALRFSVRTVSARSTAQRFQALPSSVSTSSYEVRSLFHSSSARFSEATAAAKDATPTLEHEQSEQLTRFKDLTERKLVDRSIVDALTRKMGLENMTDVQRLTIPISVTGKDVVAQAKTGTGKTVGFLVPVIQRLLSDSSYSKRPYPRRGRGYLREVNVRAIIISPTRELAEQIAVEAKRVAALTGLVVQTAVGGTQKRMHLQKMRTEGCDILVGTPGRLKDILSDESTGIKTPNLSAFVLDEADRLLDQGFGPEIMEIQDLLPKRNEVPRQTLLFSATMDREVMDIVRRTMSPGFEFVKTVRDDEVPTHLSVPQKAVVMNGLENTFLTLFELIKRNMDNERPFKGIVYFNSTKQVAIAYEIFDRLLNVPGEPRSGHPLGRMHLGEIHSRLSQAQRTRVANQFRKCKTGVLFSSDVTARGMDFPEVTHVIQIGVPGSRDDYIHRLGRTARANKTGEGWVLLSDDELPGFKRLIRGIPFDIDRNSLPSASLKMNVDADLLIKELEQSNAELHKSYQQISGSLDEMSRSEKESAVLAQMATLARSFTQGKSSLKDVARDMAIYGYGLPDLPRIGPGLASAIGLSGSSRGGGGSYGRRDSYGRDSYGRNGRGRDDFRRRDDSFRSRGPSRDRFSQFSRNRDRF
ncbi:P-loop containing nucleoside triphosphate hydrolase protein [Aspergillus egyptiacus]|nr:P-loop containing nucleoside triphosphate hydrolase protein [Aspergillus egyptiacus]